MSILGEIAALITAICWSGSSISFSEATRRAGSVLVNVTRLIIAAFFLLLTLMILQINTNINTSQLIYLGISGIIGLTLGDTFLFKAYQQLGARITSLIMSLAPAISALLAYLFLSESLTLLDLIGMFITILGIAVVVTERKDGVRQMVWSSGFLFAFLASIGQGTGLIFAKFAFQQGDINGFFAAFIRIIIGVITLLPVALFSGKISQPIKIFSENVTAFKYTILGAVLGPYLGITFSLIAISHTKVGIAATIMAIVPVTMLPLLKIFYKENITIRSTLGAFVAVAGVAILFLF